MTGECGGVHVFVTGCEYPWTIRARAKMRHDDEHCFRSLRKVVDWLRAEGRLPPERDVSEGGAEADRSVHVFVTRWEYL